MKLAGPTLNASSIRAAGRAEPGLAAIADAVLVAARREAISLLVPGTPAQFLRYAPPSEEPCRRHGRLGGCVERGNQAGKGEGGELNQLQMPLRHQEIA
jgi:hypothetical protein